MGNVENTPSELQYVRVSKLTEVDASNNLSFLAVDSTGNTNKSVRVKYSSIYNKIYTASYNAAKGYANDLSNSLSTTVSESETLIGLRINNIIAGAGSKPTLVEAKLSAISAATLCASLSDTAMSTSILGTINNISTTLSTQAKSYTDSASSTLDEKIRTLSSNLSDDVIALAAQCQSLNTATNGRIDTLAALTTASINTVSSTVAGTDNLGLVKVGFSNDEVAGNYGVKLDANNRAYVNVPGGGGGGGGSLPTIWTDLTTYIYDILQPEIGDHCLLYKATIDSLCAYINKYSDLSTLLGYYDDRGFARNLYDVIRIDARYSRDSETSYYIGSDEAIDSSSLEAKYLQPAEVILTAKSVDVENLTYVDESGVGHPISDLDEYTLIETYVIVDYLPVLDSVYIVKIIGSSKVAHKVEPIYDAIDIFKDDDDESKIRGYISLSYSILKNLYDIQDAINRFNYSTITCDITNDDSISIEQNSTKTVVLDAPSRPYEFDENYTYYPVAVKTIDIQNGGVIPVSTSIFNEKLYLTLLNTEDTEQNLDSNVITANLIYNIVYETKD